ncbi:MAG: PAS domain S-box protein [Bryobacteraceae bacterium]
MAPEVREDLREFVADLQQRLEDAEETLRALRNGEVDAVVVTGPDGERVYTLKGADEAYRVLVEGMSEGALTLGLDGVILYSNEQFASSVKRPLEQVIGSRIQDFVAPEDAGAVSSLLTARDGRKAEVRLRTELGNAVPVYLSAENLVLDDIECLCLIVTDLTEQKRSEEILAAEKLARSILEQAAEAILVVDPEGRISRASRAAERLAGAPILQREFDDVFRITTESNQAYSFREILRTLSQRRAVQNIEATAVTGRGSKIDLILSAAMLSSPESGLLGCVLHLTDITERKRREKRREEAEREARESQATLQSFYDSSPRLMGLCELDGEEIIYIYVNRATAEFLRIEAAAIAGKKVQEIGIPADLETLWAEQCRHCLELASPAQFEFEYTTDSGSRWLSDVVNYVGSGPTGLPRFSFIAEDVTEKRRADELIRQSNEDLRRANADLEQFAFAASHDLQEPLRQVALFSQLIDQKYGPQLDAKARDYLRYCVEGAQRMGNLIHDLLAYSQAGKTSQGPAALVDANEAIEEVRKNLAVAIEESGAVLTVSPLPKVYCDAVPLSHLFQNLISNALKYRSEDAPKIDVFAVDDGSNWRFTVVDNGIGIAPEYRTEVFGIFKRLHAHKTYAGSGVGLAICQKIVERYGGRIWVESEVGRGSEFHFTLPKEVG